MKTIMIKHWAEFTTKQYEQLQQTAERKKQSVEAYILCAVYFGLFLYEAGEEYWIKKYYRTRKVEKTVIIQLHMYDDQMLMKCAKKNGLPPHRIIRSATLLRMDIEKKVGHKKEKDPKFEAEE